MPAVTAPRPASTTPRSTPVKTAPSKGGAGSNGGTTTTITNGRTRPRSAVPPMTAPPKMVRAASPASSASSSASQFAPNNRDWQLDRIRRLLYEQECVELKGQLQEKEAEIETIRQEKTRITKGFWEGRARAISLLATLTEKRAQLARARSGRGKKTSSFFSSFASPHPLGASDAHVLAAAGSVGDGAAGAGDSDSELQTLQALTNIIAELGNVSSEGSTGSGNGGDGMSAEKQEGQDEEDGPNPAASSTTPEKGKANAAEVPAAAAITAAAAACCSKCHGSLAEDGDAKQKVNAPTVDEETQTATPAAGAAAASDEAPQQEEAGAGAGVFDVDLFKLKRQAAKLRDELAKKRFAEMALDVRLKETEEEAARLAELLRAKEAVVESLRLELEEKDARLMEFVSRVHDIEVRLARVARERDERTAEAEAAAEAVRFYQAKEEVDDASRRTSLASQQLQLGSRASSVSPCTSMAEGGVEEMKSSAVGGQQQQPRHLQVEETLDEEDAEVAKAVAENKTPSPTPSTATGASAASASPTDTEVDGSLGSVAPLLEAATLEEDEGHQAMRALQTPLERLVGEGMALVGKFTRHDVFLAPAVLATVAVVGLGLIFVLLRAALTGPTDACIKTTQYDGVEEAWMGAKRSPLLRLAPGGAPLLAGEYLSNCAPSADPTKLCYFLWNQFDGNLVLYRGFTPARHRGPVWSTNTLVVPGLLSEEGGRKQLSPRARQVGDHWGTANVTVWLTQDRTLQLVDAPSGQMMWQQRAWRLPRELTPWPFGQ